MTTIAYKDGCLAGDTQITNGTLKVFGVNKVFSTDNLLVGVGGPASRINSVMNWILKCEEAYTEQELECGPETFRDLVQPDFCSDDDEVEIIVICKATKSIYLMDGEGHTIEMMDHQPVAIGTGADIAMGAMYFGASAEQAVEVAIKLDAFTGGEVNKIGW